MKRVRCPECESYIVFDEEEHRNAFSIRFECSNCGTEFGIKLSVATLIVIENVFHYKQELKLKMGRNTIGRYMKGSKTTCPIHTDDPSIDITHCAIDVSRDKNGELKFILSDGPSYTGTFVDNEILGDREQRIIENDTLFTIGATSIILKVK